MKMESKKLETGSKGMLEVGRIKNYIFHKQDECLKLRHNSPGQVISCKYT